MMLVKFHGASKDGEEYVDRGPIWINTDRILAVYDHSVLIEGNTIRVMETGKEAIALIRREEAVHGGKP